uniref:Holin n=1 Tax=viral metagenome TaxID=1070528 RepID=A0A6M3IGC6_9ZZZZ
MTKKWYQSKALWLGILMVVAAGIEYINGLPVGTTILQAVSGILTIIIRFVTKTSIGR